MFTKRRQIYKDLFEIVVEVEPKCLLGAQDWVSATVHVIAL